jgi:hypothetical protein
MTEPSPRPPSRRVFGNTNAAVTTVLAAFMGGLAIGGFVFGRIADRVRRPALWEIQGTDPGSLPPLSPHTWAPPCQRTGEDPLRGSCWTNAARTVIKGNVCLHRAM